MLTAALAMIWPHSRTDAAILGADELALARIEPIQTLERTMAEYDTEAFGLE